MKKKLMILGGSRFVIPLIEKAHQMGLFVITCDYLPHNVAHKYSDMYLNVSIIDKEAVLKKAIELNIDGITSFACDPGVVSAAYVAEKMGLANVGPYKSVVILQNKDKFRSFLKDNGFNVPWFFNFHTYKELLNKKALFTYPLIVKPIDSAGSKGVTKLNDNTLLKEAFNFAKSNSLSGHVIVEEFLENDGHSSSADCFSVEGKLVFSVFSDQQFDLSSPNIFNPCGTVLPSSMPEKSQCHISNELQKLISLLHMETSIYNVESRLSTNGKEYLMEVSPRGGGNNIAELEAIAYDFDYIELVIRASLGMPICFKEHKLKYPSMTVVLHSHLPGVFKNIYLADELKPYLVKTDINVKAGDYIDSFNAANKGLGTLFFRFPSVDILRQYTSKINDLVKVILYEQ